jgi:hypothetical protein
MRLFQQPASAAVLHLCILPTCAVSLPLLAETTTSPLSVDNKGYKLCDVCLPLSVSEVQLPATLPLFAARAGVA